MSRLLIGFGEITAFDDVDAHKAQEVPRNGIDLPTGIFATHFSSPTHAGILDEGTVTPSDILDGGIGFQLTLHRLAVVGKIP